MNTTASIHNIPVKLLSRSETEALAEKKVREARNFVNAVLEVRPCQDYLLKIWQARKSSATLSDHYGSAHEIASDRSHQINDLMDRAMTTGDTVARASLFRDADLSFDLYVEAADRALMTRSERKTLQSQYAKYLALRNILVTHNLKLVPKFVSSMVTQGVAYEDLLQYGALGLIRAIDKYDPSHGTRISTYARWWILRVASDAVKDVSRTIRIPRHVRVQIQKLNRYKSQYFSEHQSYPTEEQIWAKFPHLPPTKQEVLYQSSLAILPTAALDATNQCEYIESFSGVEVSDEASELECAVQTDPDAEQYAEVQGMLRKIRQVLTATEQEVVTKRFGIGCAEQSVGHVARQTGLSSAMVKLIEEQAMQKLRTAMGAGLE